MIAVQFDKVSKAYDLHAGEGTILKSIRTISGLQKKDDLFYALSDVSFTIKKGEALGIIGRNGAGKSTILKIISGITRPTSGAVTVNGLVSSLIELGAGFHPDLTGRENVYLSAAILGIPKKVIDRKFEEIVDFAELWDFIDVPVKKYSSGMYARLGFSVAISVEPEILIIDEILSVGDVFFQQKCFRKMRDLIQQGITFIFVTHDTVAIQNLCNRAMLVDGGKVEYVGSTTEVVNRYYARVGQRPLWRPVAPLNSDRNSEDGSEQLCQREELIENSVIKGNVHRHGDRVLELLAARVTDMSGADTLTIPINGTLLFHLLLSARENIAVPASGLNLYDRMGNLVFSAGTPQLHTPIPALFAGQEVVLCFELELSVQPGEYTFTLVTSEPSADGNPNTGYFHDIHERLGPINVVADVMKVFPFYGIARLPMKIKVGRPYHRGA